MFQDLLNVWQFSSVWVWAILIAVVFFFIGRWTNSWSAFKRIDRFFAKIRYNQIKGALAKYVRKIDDQIEYLKLLAKDHNTPDWLFDQEKEDLRNYLKNGSTAAKRHAESSRRIMKEIKQNPAAELDAKISEGNSLLGTIKLAPAPVASATPTTTPAPTATTTP